VRVYYAASGSWADVGIDDFKINGTVFAVQDLTVQATDGGSTLSLQGNGWASVDQAYTVTANTVLEVEFAASAAGEIQGIGVDDGSGNLTFFQLFGTQNFAEAIQDYATYSNPSLANRVTYSIPLGDHYTGDIASIVFANDADQTGSLVESTFTNVTIDEAD